MFDKNDLSATVVSSRIRFAKNIEDYKFPNKFKDKNEGALVCSFICNRLSRLLNIKPIFIKDLDDFEKNSLVETRVISKKLVQNNEISAYFMDAKNKVVVMINEEDHIREQCVLKGYNLDLAYVNLQRFDNIILNNFAIAQNEKFGYLTACYSNVGTGLRASVMMFLPGLSILKNIQSVITYANNLGLTIRGTYGEGSNLEGYLFQISNEYTYNISEEQIISNVKDAVERISELELEAREKLLQAKKDELLDRAYRAFGILKSSYILSVDEFNKLILNVKMGMCLNLIDLENNDIITEIEETCGYYNIMKRYGKEITEKESNKFRAEYLRKKLSGINI